MPCRSKEIYAVGHITNDMNPEPHVSGGVAYAACAAASFGYGATIITKCPETSPYLSALRNRGIVVHRLPNRDTSFDDKITTFINVFDSDGKRSQVVSEQQELIDEEDLSFFPDIPADAQVLIAPVIGEVSPSVFTSLSRSHNMFVTPQGYFRRIDSNGKVIRERWRELALLALPSLIVLSNEDISFGPGAGIDSATLDTIKAITAMAIVTMGEDGSEIFKTSENYSTQIKAFRLEADEVVDLSGAGDVYAMAFFAQLEVTADPHLSGVFASLFAALKIMDLQFQGAGLPTVPSLKDVEAFINNNPQRYCEFLKNNRILQMRGIIGDKTPRKDT